jgi:hypothetical protein
MKTPIHSHKSPIINTNLTRTWPNAVFCVVVFGFKPKQQKILRHSNGVINFCTVMSSLRLSSHALRLIAVERPPKQKNYEWFISLPREHHALASVVRLTTCLSLMISAALRMSFFLLLYNVPSSLIGSVHFSRPNEMSTHDAKSGCSIAQKENVV